MTRPPIEEALEESLRANQALLLLSVHTMLEEATDLEDAKRRLMAVIQVLTNQ